MKNLVLGGMLACVSALAHADVETLLRPTARPDVLARPKADPFVETPEILLEAAMTAPANIPDTDADLTTRTPRFTTTIRPPARSGDVPRTRWQHMGGHVIWTRAAISALKAHGKPLVDMVPRDIENWCPAYKTGSDADRRAFWVGFMSSLAKHESTYKPWAVGGGGRWYGLLQILPGTARGYKCNVGTGEALKNGAANLSCAVRILAHTVPRDGVIHGYSGGRGRGVTADWGPMHSAPKRQDMARWLRRQSYCKPLNETRPKVRP
ncbi:transglycosylase SLT domain-containing protein [Sulfitobacter brevis]|nr:transglycosylase SLT domain-containing protein [Sulfitobacter brevis]